MNRNREERILFCRSNPVNPDPRVEKETRALNAAGYDVHILAWNRTGVLPSHETINGVQCHRLLIRASYGAGIRNLPALLRWQFGLLKWLVKNYRRFDIIHACDFDTVIPAVILRLFYGKSVVYDIFDFYADHLRSTPNWILQIIRWLDLKIIHWVDAVILVDETRRQQIKGSHPKKLAVIYNSPEDIARIQPKLPEKSSLKIVYVGLLQVERGLFELIEVLRKHPEWTLELAGFGGDEKEIVSIINGMSNINWHGRVSYDHAMKMSGSADVFIATYDPAIPNHRYSSPNKIFEAMMFGRPVIVAHNTNMDRVIQKHNCGVVIDYGDVDQLEKALTNLQKNPALAQKLGKNARRAYETSFRWSIMKSRLIELYDSVARREG